MDGFGFLCWVVCVMGGLCDIMLLVVFELDRNVVVVWVLMG